MKARIVWVLVVVLAAAAGVWAGRVTFSPPTAAVTGSPEPLYTVAEETVGRSLTFPVTATWARSPLGAGAASGTVTSIEVEPGSTVQAGQALYTVDLRPVVVMGGAVPAFRELSAGTAGADVRQLQEFLRDEGYLEVSSPDGTFGSATTRAVRAWQKAAGFLPVDGVVRAGDVVFATTLPARVVLDPSIQVGGVVPAGQAVASVLSPAPTFEIQLGVEQAPLVPTSGPAQVLSGERTWDAVISSATTTDQGLLVLELTAPDGGAVCGSDCDDVPVEGETAVLTGKIIAVEDATGPAVPAAAIQTRADGSAFVVTQQGEQTTVTVVSQGDGRAVVEGIEVGDVIRLFGDTPQGAGS